MRMHWPEDTEILADSLVNLMTFLGVEILKAQMVSNLLTYRCIVIKHNERIKHFFFIKTYLSFYSRKGPTVCC